MNQVEKRILKNIIKKYEEDKPSITSRRWFNPVLWVVLCALIFLLLQLKESDGIGNIVLIVISAFAGAGVMLVSAIQSGEKSWRIMKPLINIEKAKSLQAESNT
ncbi:hypothetical protein SAMN02745866_04351 [Alteromonadaceae bacterium Bs31]|nr:hypothetical protein SAMN02745866_04351 [Alteromonadaceae bacterium Bs31]